MASSEATLDALLGDLAILRRRSHPDQRFPEYWTTLLCPRTHSRRSPTSSTRSALASALMPLVFLPLAPALES